MANFEEFRMLMDGLLSTENSAREEAEKRLEEIPKPLRVQLLFRCFLGLDERTAIVREVRSLCLILIRRLLSKDWEEIWPFWEEEVKKSFCDQLIKSAANEDHSVLRKRLTDVISEVARSTKEEATDKQNWTCVLQFLDHCGTSNLPVLQEIAMSLIENDPAIFGCDRDMYLAGIKQIFESSLSAEKSSVRTAAVRAYVSFMSEFEDDDKIMKGFCDLIPATIKVCSYVIETENDDDVPLQCLGDLVTTVSKVLRPYIDDIFALCLPVPSNKAKDDTYRHSALEVMVTVCESVPKLMKKRGTQYVSPLLQQCLELMTELDDDLDAWLAVDDADEDDDLEENVTTGESALDRICCALGGKIVLHPLLQLVSPLINDANDWKHRYAGIMALSTAGEGCKKTMETIIADIVANILHFTQDSHPRVRYAACNAIGQMSADFEPVLQKKCHEKVIDALCNVLTDLLNPRVAAHAGAALVNFSEDCPKKIITIHLPKIMEKLEYVLEHTFKQLLERGKKLVLVQIITTIASVADAAQEHFIVYYDQFMPSLKYILQNASTPELKVLRGKSIECISLIGLAVGREKFSRDAHEIMQILLANRTYFEHLTSDDPEVSYMISSWARICKILGDEFALYLPVVMPPVIQAATKKPDIALMTDEEASSQEDDSSWTFVPVGDQRMFGVNTTGLEEKTAACEMLVCYARELKLAFDPYVEEVIKLMLPLLKFLFSESVRSAAAEIFPYLFVCSRGRGHAFQKQLLETVISAYKDAISSEHALDVAASQITALAECITEAGAEVASDENLTILTDIINERMERYHTAVKNITRRESAAEDDEDDDGDEAIDEDLEENITVFCSITDLVHSVFMIYRERFAPFFERIEPHFRTLIINSRRSHSEGRWAICIYDDLIEFGGEVSVKYQMYFTRPMLDGLSDQSAVMRQACAYGFGVMGLYGGSNYAEICAGSLPHLANLISRPESRSLEDATNATENAISAVVKILKYNSSRVDVNSVIPSLLTWLPTWEDTDESVYIYGYLADLIECNNLALLGPDNINLPRILYIIVEAFHRDAFSNKVEHESVKHRLISILKHLQSNSEMFQAVVSNAGLREEHVATLQRLLS